MNLASLENAIPGIHIETDVKVPMRDGVKLAADIYRPESETTLPVLLMRQPYGRDIASTVVYAQPIWFAKQGYIVVIQDVRGRGDSEGEFYPFRNETQDGFDTIEWVSHLEGSNGKVGMYGFSYQASTQLYAALSGHPALKAIAPHMTAFDLYSGWFYRAGMLQLNTTLGWGNQMLRENVKRSGPGDLYKALEKSWANTNALTKAFPISEVQPLTDERGPTFVKDWLEHDEYDEYWEQFDLLKQLDKLDIPMFHLSGWYDYYHRGSIAGYEAMAATHKNQLLYVGPWVHIPWGDNLCGWNFGDSAKVDINAIMIRWFDRWLKGIDSDTPIEGVHYFSMGDNQWHHYSSLSADSVAEKTYYLGSQGNANSRFGDGFLSDDPEEEGTDTYNYDPEVPVLAPGGGFDGSLIWGPSDLRQSQSGNNLLVYTSQPLSSEMKIRGKPQLELLVSSSASNTLFVARLSAVQSSGSVRFLCLGVIQLNEGAIMGDGKTQITIELDMIAYTFSPDECIRLDISSSAFPLLARHPNGPLSANKLNGPEDFDRAVQIIHYDLAAPSTLKLCYVDS